jgi:hypothetical protein
MREPDWLQRAAIAFMIIAAVVAIALWFFAII